MNIQLIHQDTDYIVISKPAGISVHKSGQRDEYTIADWVLENYPQTKDVGEALIIGTGEKIARHGIVHRLDKDTSGIMIIALTQKGYEFFKNQFKNREIKKFYHAFLYGNLKEDHMTIQEPIGRHAKDFRKRTVGKNVRGATKSAITFFKVVERYKINSEHIVFVEAQPKTGRTHQIRVHARYIQHPVIADLLYASRKEKLLGFKRLALHAQKIQFTDMNGFSKEYIAEYPDDFVHAQKLCTEL